MQLRKLIDQCLSYILVFILATMTLNVIWQVFSRYILKDPSIFTDELARFLMIWLGLLGAAYISGRNGHVAIDILVKKSSEKSQKILKFLVGVIIIFFVFLVFIIGGGGLVHITYTLDQYSPALQVPLAYVYIVIPISGIIIIYYTITDLFKS